MPIYGYASCDQADLRHGGSYRVPNCDTYISNRFPRISLANFESAALKRLASAVRFHPWPPSLPVKTKSLQTHLKFCTADPAEQSHFVALFAPKLREFPTSPMLDANPRRSVESSMLTIHTIQCASTGVLCCLSPLGPPQSRTGQVTLIWAEIDVWYASCRVSVQSRASNLPR